MFALNFCYQPVDLVLVIKCGILDILSMLTNNSCALMNQGWFAASTSGPMMLSSAVKLACNRLLQILTVVARWELMEPKEMQENTFWWQAANHTLTQSRLSFTHHYLFCALSSCEDMLPLDVSCALMAVMCEQLQSILNTFLQLQAAKRETTEKVASDSTSKATNLMGFSGTVFFLSLKLCL